MSAIVIAVAGATGHVGAPMVRAFLSPKCYPSQIKRVIAFTRDSDSEVSKELKALGAELETRGISTETLKDVDVAVNAMPGYLPSEVSDAFATAAADAGVKVFFTSEFGASYTDKFVDDKFHFYDKKIKTDKFAREVGGGRLKVIGFQTGAWMEWSIALLGPLIGLDVANRLFSAPGSVDNRLTFTAMDDVTSAMVQLCVLGVHNPTSVPDHVQICGDAKSWRELADIIGKEIGEKIECKPIPMDEHMKVAASPEFFPSFLAYLRLWYASEGVDYSLKNDNELVNPGEKLWKWKRVEDYVKGTGGVFPLPKDRTMRH